jgi:hypothetical protein
VTPSDETHLVPALIADAGDQAAWHYLEFFTANIRIRTSGELCAHVPSSLPGAMSAA